MKKPKTQVSIKFNRKFIYFINYICNIFIYIGNNNLHKMVVTNKDDFIF